MNGRIVVVGLLGFALGALRLLVVATAEGPERRGGRATIPNTVAGIWHDVRASSPGACPICGMKLVRAKG